MHLILQTATDFLRDVDQLHLRFRLRHAIGPQYGLIDKIYGGDLSEVTAKHLSPGLFIHKIIAITLLTVGAVGRLVID